MQELQSSAERFGHVLGSISGTAVMCTDWRGMRVLAPEVADILLGIMKSDNHRVARQAWLIDPKAIIGLQLERLFRDGGGLDRRTFTESVSMTQWLGEVLNTRERQRVTEFLNPHSFVKAE